MGFYLDGCRNCVRQKSLCGPSSGPGTLCVICQMCKVRCDKSEGPASNRAARSKEVGTPKKCWSSWLVDEGAGKGMSKVSEMMRVVVESQQELVSALRGIRDKLKLHNDIVAMDWDWQGRIGTGSVSQSGSCSGVVISLPEYMRGVKETKRGEKVVLEGEGVQEGVRKRIGFGFGCN